MSWNVGAARPPSPGRYERASALGVVVDVWDGKAWRRERHRVELRRHGLPEFAGVICANQGLPWRQIDG